MSGKPKRVCDLTMVFGSGEPCRSCLLYHSGAAQAQRRREGAKKGVEEQRLEQTDVFKKLSWQMKTTKNKLRWYRQQPQRLFLQIFLKRAHARKQTEEKRTSPEPSLQPSPEPSPKPSLQPSPESVELDLALHQSFLEPSPEPSPEPC